MKRKRHLGKKPKGIAVLSKKNLNICVGGCQHGRGANPTQQVL